MKKIIAVLLLLLTVCMSFTACDILGSGGVLGRDRDEGEDQGSVDISLASVFELYSLVEFDMSYEEVVELFQAESTSVDKENNSVIHYWSWNNNFNEYVNIAFENNKVYFKSYGCPGFDRDMETIEYEMWESIDSIDLDVFLERYGQYVALTSHFIYKDSIEYAEYISIDSEKSFYFSFYGNTLESKSYYITKAYDSPEATSNIISDEALSQIEAAIADDEIHMTHEDVCILIGSKGVLRHIFEYIFNHYRNEEYYWWTLTGDVISIEFLNGDLHYCRTY